ncbi:MAG: DNA primase [Puniceicoccaceae bacterium]
MPFFSEETLQAVRAIPLYDIVRGTVELSRSGRNWKGLSPFTDEKTPSFYILTDKNYYKCHSSGLAGDGIRFLQETEKLTFPEAVEALAERFNIPVTYASGQGPDPEVRSLKQALLDIHEYAREYYHQAFLADHPVAEEIRRYWIEERGFPLELAEEFSIGFAPPKSRRLLEVLQGKGFSNKALAESGLFHTRGRPSDPDSWFFVFNGRLMIPIRDLQGQVIAFTARQLEMTPKDHASWKAKYINSPETLLFRKSHLLFNLDRAKEVVRESGRILLVEGQLDALRCWNCGLKDAVAPQGTSVTEDQLKLVKRYVDRLEVLLDNDAAGAKAVLRLLPMAFKCGLEVHVINLPEGEDPDDFLLKNGAEAVAGLENQSGISFAGKVLVGTGAPSPEQRSKALHSLFEMLAACPSAVVREGYFEDAVAATGVSREAARQDFARFSVAAPTAKQAIPAKTIKRGTNSSETLTNLEGDLVWAVLKNVGWAESLAQVIDHQWIRIHTIEGKVLSRILAQATVDRIENSDDILFLLETDEERDCVARYTVDDRPDSDMPTYVNQTIASLARRFCKERVDHLNQEISKTTQTNSDPSQIRDFMMERQELMRFMQTGPFPTAESPPASTDE